MKRRLLTGRSFDEGMSPNVIMAPYFHFSFFFLPSPSEMLTGSFRSALSQTASEKFKKKQNKNKINVLSLSTSAGNKKKKKKDLLISLSQQVQKKRNEWFLKVVLSLSLCSAPSFLFFFF